MEYPLDNKILELFHKGFSEREIAKKLSVPTDTIEYIFIRLGLYDY